MVTEIPAAAITLSAQGCSKITFGLEILNFMHYESAAERYQLAILFLEVTVSLSKLLSFTDW